MIALSRERIVTMAGAAVLFVLALTLAVRFRALPPPTDLRAMTWDAASHALIGLDVFDHIRRLEPVQLLVRLQAEHWWPPLFGILSLPAYALGGRELTSPSLVSLASYALIPPFAWLLVRRASKTLSILVFALVFLFTLRSPQLIEMSTWSMLELAATIFAVLCFYLFLYGPGTRARKWSYGFAGASTLLKYHYGFFLLVATGAATLAEMSREELRAAGEKLRALLRKPAVLALLAILSVSTLASLASQAWQWKVRMPGVPNLIWFAYILTVIVVLMRRKAVRAAWNEWPEPLRRFASCGLIWPLVWFLDLSNVQAYARELRVSSDPPARWSEQVSEVWRYLTDDYFLGPVMLGVAAFGLLLGFIEGVRRRHAGVLMIAAHAVWPVALMTLSKFRIESRFLSSMMVMLMVAAAIGWMWALQRTPQAARVLIGGVLFCGLVLDQAARADEFEQMLARRRVYGYLSSDPPDRFVRATVHSFRRGLPVLIILPRDIQVVSPTIRLGLRLAMPGVRPDHVVVRGGDLHRFQERLRRFQGGMVGLETDAETLHRLAAEHGFRVVEFGPGPPLPEGNRALLMARLAR